MFKKVLLSILITAILLILSVFLLYHQPKGDGGIRISIKPKEVDLTADLESSAIDYLFIYRSVALQHGFRFVELPDEVNLSNITFKDNYSKVVVRRADGGEVKGKPIVYGVTIPDKCGPRLQERPYALEFVRMLLGDVGREILTEGGQKPLRGFWGDVPPEINSTTPPPQPTKKVPLRVLHAGSLSFPFQELKKRFEAEYPTVSVNLEAYGSVMAIKQVTELHTNASVVASADYSLIGDMMGGYSDWYATFASNSIVLSYTDKSRYSQEINPHNWMQIIFKTGVVVGFSSPNDDPCGYRTVMVIKLSDLYYGSEMMKTLEEVMGIKEEDLDGIYYVEIPPDSKLMG